MVMLDIIALVGAAWLLARLAHRVRLPPLLGMIAAGVVVGNLVTPWTAPLGGPQLEQLAPPLRLAILALVLLRAGLGIDPADLRRAGALTVALGLAPMMGDAVASAALAVVLFDLGWAEALALGFLVAAISPAIVIPGMLDLLSRRHGSARRLPTALLAGAPLDNIAAVLALGVMLDLALSSGGGFGAALARLPLQMGGGLTLGGLAGWLLGRLWPRTWIAPRSGGVALWALSGGVIALCQLADLSTVLALLSLGLVAARTGGESAISWQKGLTSIWTWAQLLLFGLIGASVDLGPLTRVGPRAVVVVLAGQLGRALAVVLVTGGAGLSWAERLAAILAYMPKATIQAAFAGLPGDRGLPGADLLLSTAVLAIVIAAPLGTVALCRGADALLPTGRKPAS